LRLGLGLVRKTLVRRQGTQEIADCSGSYMLRLQPKGSLSKPGVHFGIHQKPGCQNAGCQQKAGTSGQVRMGRYEGKQAISQDDRMAGIHVWGWLTDLVTSQTQLSKSAFQPDKTFYGFSRLPDWLPAKDRFPRCNFPANFPMTAMVASLVATGKDGSHYIGSQATSHQNAGTQSRTTHRTTHRTEVRKAKVRKEVRAEKPYKTYSWDAWEPKAKLPKLAKV